MLVKDEASASQFITETGAPQPGPRAPAPVELDRADFARQVEREMPFLRSRARRWHREQADIDDLVQDTLVQALANAHLWQQGSDLRAWLYTIMRNRFLAGVNRSVRSASALAEFAVADPAPPTPMAELRLLLRDLGDALRRLSANQRSAVILIGVQGKSYDEAAQSMGTSVGAVRSHLARGRERLRTAVRGSDARPVFAARQAAADVRGTPLVLILLCAGRLLIYGS
jgi:RNA polymerase sigma-70 factor (ECF subfamily)